MKNISERPRDKDGNPISEGKEIDAIRDRVEKKQISMAKRSKLAKELSEIYEDKDGNICNKCQNRLQGVLVGQPDMKTDWIMGIRICNICKIVEDFITHPEADNEEVIEVGTALRKKSEDYLNK